MPIDPILFKKSNTSKAIQVAVADKRESISDHVEAKANVQVQRILSSANGVAQKPAPAVQPQHDGFYVPPKSESGLVSDDFQLDESQIEAVNMLVTQQYGCMIGAAGTGKTTTMRAFLHKMIYGDEELGVNPISFRMLEGKQGPNIALCAFTGIATQVIKQNMPAWMHNCCKTIHSLLEYGPVTTEITTDDGQIKESTIFMPYRHAGNKLDHSIIVIDEASMVGLSLWHELLDACRPGTKIFLIGDLNQLPPVFSQSMFAYVLSSWQVAELTHIHRQKESSANKIVDVAHAILNGEKFEFDDARTNRDWRVIGMELDRDPQKAGVQVVAIANNIRDKKVHESIDPETPLIYDPYRDRIITAGNGYDDNNSTSAIQQYPINQALSRLIEPPSEMNPIIIIDAGMTVQKFAIGHRVMATRNEPPDVKDRVTNGMVGRIVHIEKNFDWRGDWHTVGPEEKVIQTKTERLQALFDERGIDEENGFDIMEGADSFTFRQRTEEEKEAVKMAASHAVTVDFANGATRVFKSKSTVASLQLAYASTCHKTQGSQMDTVIIVCHHAAKAQLNREWFYTAVTRAIKRVIVLYTPHGIRVALANQRIFGRTLEEKIKRYRDLQERDSGPVKLNVRLTIEGS